MKPIPCTWLRYFFIISLLLVGISACGKPESPPPPSPAASTQTQPEPVVIPQHDVAENPLVNIMPLPAPTESPKEVTPMPESSKPAEPTKPTRPKVPAFTQQTQADNDLFLRFLATGESFYTEIRLEHGILTYTYFEDLENRCQQWVKSTPCWREADLKRISAALTTEELDNLYTLARESGILKLAKDHVGGAKQGQRYYAQHLEVRVNGKAKHIIYEHFPGAAQKPEAFAQLETALVEYARDLPH